MIDHLKKISLDVKRAVDEFMENSPEISGEIIKIGADGTPTSRLDIVAEDVVFKYVEENDLPLNILSEEYGFLARGYDKTLVLDPLDGSYNAENNIPFYSISMAIGRKSLSDVEEGFVMNLASGRYYWAIKGSGAFFMEKRIRRMERKEALGVISLGKNVRDYVFNAIKETRRIRSMGCASLEMIMVAEGNADYFIYDYKNRNVLRIIDIAASTLIVRESGGYVFDLDTFSDLDMPFDLKERRNIVAFSKIETLDKIRGWKK
ncbi:MAG: inositol monophosphatase family protein [Thermoplasmata archaeon]|nr:inositol monophosphatase [Euryarchaeota archaeon]MVT35196.1 inositol monophosphatase [Euryarchaeota archaeon]